MSEIEDKYSLENSSKAFNELINNQCCLPNWFKTGIEKALLGKKLFSAQDVLQLTREEFHASDYIDQPEKIKEFDLILSAQDLENLDRASWLSEEIIGTTLRTHYGWGIKQRLKS